MDLPIGVAQLVKSYDLSSLRWDNIDDRYVVVREILDRGSTDARQWLDQQLSREDIRKLLCEFRGAGFDEPARARLRAEFELTAEDIPVRPFIAWNG
ncbi:MAG TPA: hypothetical protein VFH68_22335 [Polyangia bacterium]|jgi:hypothetical protein|nr:hypothetical protein [Polyangia bacterium]